MIPSLESPVLLAPLSSANSTQLPAAHGLIRRAAGWLLHAIPTVLAFGLLAGVGWWGHSTGWKMSKRDVLMGTAAPVVPDDWCADHGVPESVCVECDDSLMPPARSYGWCPTHGISNCPTCHPEVAQLSGTPDPMPYDAVGPLTLFPRTANSAKCELHKRRLQFATVEAADKAGIDVDVVDLRPMTEVVNGHGELGYDPTTVVRLSPRTGGSVWKVFKTVGDTVAAGEVVALVDAPAAGKAKTDYVTAAVQARLAADTAKRMKAIPGAVAERTAREAEATAEEARLRLVAAEQGLATLGLPVPAEADTTDPRAAVARLRFAGLPAALADSLASDPTVPPTLLPVVATQPGVVVATGVVAGEVADPAKLIVTTADVRKLWLTLHVRPDEIRHITVGRPVRFKADTGGEELTGVIAWVSPAVDDKFRTVPLRVEVANPDGKLRANTFVAGRVVLRNEPKAVSVPKGAIQWEGDCNVVFVRDKDYLKPGSPKVFHVRQVRVGATDGTHVELLAGVRPGEVVVTTGSAVLRGELLRNGLGEGCACHKK